MLRTTTLFLIFALGLLLIGCGTSNPGTTTATPNPTTFGSAPPPGTPTPSTSPDSYLAQIFVSVGKNPMSHGQVTVDTTANNGAGNVQVTNFATNSTLVLQFCPYPQGFTNCINVTSITTDMSGSANVNFTFPQKGTFSGVFQIVLSDGSQFAATGTGSSGTNFQSAMLPAGSITGGINQTTGSASGSGSVSVNGTTAHLILSGTTPNHVFNTAVCSVFLATPCTALANVTTDAQGNVSMDIGPVQPAGWSVFRASDTNGVQFVSAFRVQ